MENINWGSIIEDSLGYLIGLIIVGIIGYFKRKKLSLIIKKLKFKLRPRNFQVVFALEFDEGLNSGNYYRQIKKEFLKQIDNSGLSKQIKVLDISDIYLFNKTDDAEKFRRTYDLDLIIWGDFSNDKLKIEKELVNKIDLNFTFRIPQNFDQLKSFLALDLKSKLAQKSYWKIYENNSLQDITIISSNLFDIATYTLALSLKIFGQLEKSTHLFEKLYADLEKRNDGLKKQLVPHLINCYSILGIEYGHYRKDYKRGINYCDKTLLLDPIHFSSICNKALYEFHSGNKETANNYIEKLKELYPKSDYTIIDVAFFRILEEDYTSALRGYKKLKHKYRNVKFNVPEVIEFLDDQYIETKEPAMLFASGFINCHYGDLQIGKNDFNKFLLKADSNKHNALVKETNRLLSIDFK